MEYIGDMQYAILQEIFYFYDEQNRLVREDNRSLNFTKTYTYDLGGNIENIYEYDFSGGYELGAFRGKYTFVYAENYNSCHKNFLTNVYYSTDLDSLGNCIDSWGLIDSFTRLGWHNGVRLEYDSNGRLAKHGEMSFEYDSNGIRQIKRHIVSDGDYLYNGHQTDNITEHVYYTEGNIIHKEVMKFVWSYDIFCLLCNFSILWRKKFRTYRCI